MHNKNQKPKNLELEGLTLLYSSLVSSQVAIFFGGLIIVVFLKDQIPTLTLSLWFISLVISIIYRIAIKHSFSIALNTDTFIKKKWENKFLFGVFLSATVWGSAGVVLYAQQSTMHQMFLELSIAVICLVAIRILSPSYRALLIFIPVTLFPIAIMTLASGNEIGVPMTGLIVIYLGISFSTGKRLNNSFKENHKLRIDSIQNDNNQLYKQYI